MPLHVSSTCAHHQEVKIALHSLWYHHIYRCDVTRGCVKQCWPPDDEDMCSKHVETWNKLIVKQKFCTSIRLITEMHSQQNVKICSWYHHTYRFNDTRGCVTQFWPPEHEHMCSKHVEAWNKTYCRTKSLCIKLVNYWDKKNAQFLR